MSLVDRIRGEKGKPKMPNGYYMGHEAQWAVPLPEGYLIDGAVYPLDGQPEPARGGSWGDMSWVRRRWW